MVRHILLATAIGVAAFLPAHAETLPEALRKAYDTNPTITAARAGLRATDENVPIARAAGLPSVGVTGNFSQNVLSSSNSVVQPPRSFRGSGTISIPIFSGGAVKNSVAAAKTRVEAGRSSLSGTESDLFTNVVGAYMDVIRDEAIVGLNQQNVHVLEVNLQATQDRFQVGDLTRTDVAQSLARLSLARAQLDTAQANLIGSRENFVRLVGSPPDDLQPPPALPGLPASPEQAVQIALANNPSLEAARRAAEASRYDINVAKAARYPQVSINTGGNYVNYLGSLASGTGANFGQSGTAGTIGLGLTIPIFQGGAPGARVRQAEAYRSQALEQRTEVERAVVSQTRSAFASWQAAGEVIRSSEAAVAANKLSLEGVRAENSVGNRTILDILNAEQELLNSQVTLVSARRDAYVAGFALLAAMGRAQAKTLDLGGGTLYDPVVHYDAVRHRISDWSSDPMPQPISPGTADTPAQNATVTPSEVPQLESPVDSGIQNPAGDVTTPR